MRLSSIAYLQHQQLFQTLQASVETLKVEQRTIAQNLRDDLRRTDDRAQKQVNELRMQHAEEVERLTEIIKLLIAKETSAVKAEQPPAPRLPQQFGAPAKKEEKENNDDSHEEDDEYEPQVDFTPVVPLPDLVEVKTGEEGEEVVFKHRAKLYRFDRANKEWKERGTGDIKILKNPSTGKYRVVMRREQVHKLCANFAIIPTIELKQKVGALNVFNWICKDFSEVPEGSDEMMSLKFKTAETATAFREAFNKAQITPAKPAAAPKKDKKKEADKIKVPEEPKAAAGFGDQFKKKEDEWDCPDCYTRNKADTCLCCGTNRHGSKGNSNSIFSEPAAQADDGKPKFSFGQSAGGAITAPMFSFGIPAASKETPKEAATTVTSTTKEAEKPKFSFGAAAAVAAKEEAPVNTPQKPGLFGASAAPKFSFGGAYPATASPSASIFGGAKPTDGKPAAAASFSFVKKEENPSTSSPVSFSFKAPTSPAVVTPDKSLFGQSAEKSTEGGSAAPATTSSRIFGSGLAGGASGNAFAETAKSSTTSIFNDEARKKAEEQFASQKKSMFGAPAKKEEKENDDDDHGGDEDYEPQVDFTPVVPLPDLVEVKTGEEGEEVVFKHRAKLYRFDRANKEWKERGTGDIKILKNPSTGKYRVVMRREQVHKLCANFAIIPAIELRQKVGALNVVNWMCKDFSEAPEGSDEMMSLKFKTAETATAFREAFNKAQSE